MRKLSFFLSGFLSDNRGVAAVEMAFIAPVIAGLAFASVNLWEAASRKQEMTAAVHAASQYYLSGGSSDTDAQSIAMSAWSNRPDDGDVDITRSCRCGSVVATCSTLCESGQAPAVLVRITAQATSVGAAFQPSQSKVEIVRVR
jgi:hypothetical protein